MSSCPANRQQADTGQSKLHVSMTGWHQQESCCGPIIKDGLCQSFGGRSYLWCCLAVILTTTFTATCCCQGCTAVTSRCKHSPPSQSLGLWEGRHKHRHAHSETQLASRIHSSVQMQHHPTPQRALPASCTQVQPTHPVSLPAQPLVCDPPPPSSGPALP
jgi:hypothetical protein